MILEALIHKFGQWMMRTKKAVVRFYGVAFLQVLIYASGIFAVSELLNGIFAISLKFIHNVTYRVTVGTLIRRTISVTMIIKLQQR